MADPRNPLLDPFDAESKSFPERVKQLESIVRELQAARGITVDELPLQDLKDKLEQTWQPNAADLLAPGTIPYPTLTGSATGTLDGSGALVKVVNHSLLAVPSYVGITLTNAITNLPKWSVTAKGNTSFTVSFSGGTAGAAVAFDWLIHK